MVEVIYGSLSEMGLEVVRRDGRLFLRYDAGAHQSEWREDEITDAEFAQLRLGGEEEYRAIISVQSRLSASGENPNKQNWERDKT